jgi:hypothetical protein
LTPSSAEATLVRIVEASLDAYDDLIDHAAEEIRGCMRLPRWS